MTLPETGTANDAARLQQTHQQESVNHERSQTEIPHRAPAQATQELAGESAGEGAGRTALDCENSPAPICESRFADALALEIDRAPIKHLDYLARQLWSAHANGTIDDDTAQELAESLAERQRERGRPNPGPKNALAAISVPSWSHPPLRRQRSPDRARSIERRRRLAASGPMPPHLSAHFTIGELAVLKIVGDEVRAHGVCGLHVDALAARAGVGRTTAQNAIREAYRLGLLIRQERRRRGRPSLTNLVRIISAEWLTWLRLDKERGGFKKSNTTGSSDIKSRSFSRGEGPQRGYREGGGGSFVPRTGRG